MSRGLAPDGELVALVVWHPRIPWRLSIPEGVPPPDVTARERRYSDCLYHLRTVLNGRCDMTP